MGYRYFFALFFSFLSCGVCAHADTISNFTFQGSNLYGGADTNKVSGSITIDITTGIVQNVSFTAGGIFQTGVNSQNGPVVFVGTSNSKLSFDAGSLINYSGSKFDLNGPNDLYVGSVTANSTPSVAATPEPSSLMLLATGLFGVAYIARRRYCSPPAQIC